MRILLACDLEEAHAANVAAFALAIADNFKAHLTVYHAFGRPQATLGDATEEQREGKVLVELSALIKSIKGPSFDDVEISYKADVDYPADGITNEAEAGDYDLVVCGLRERNAGESQFSSLSYKILREVPKNVLAIPPQADFHGVKEIVFATNLDAPDHRVLEELQAWRRNMTADIYVVHVYEGRDQEEEARRILSVWREEFGKRPRNHFELTEGDFATDIGEYVRKRGGDMLVVQSSKKGFFERLFEHSAAEDVAHTTDVPLLVMRGGVGAFGIGWPAGSLAHDAAGATRLHSPARPTPSPHGLQDPRRPLQRVRLRLPEFRNL